MGRGIGWSCHGYEDGVESINIEWPLVSNKALLRFQWRPSSIESITEADIFKVTTNLLDLHCLHDMSLYSAGIAVLFLMTQESIDPLDFLSKFRSEIPEIWFVEIKLWLSVLLKPKKTPSVWIHINLSEVDLVFADNIKQPWLRAQGILNEKVVQFSMLLLETTTSGETLSCKFLVPIDLPLSSILLFNFNTIHHVYNVGLDAITSSQFMSDGIVGKTNMLRRKQTSYNTPSVKRQSYSAKGLKNRTSVSRVNFTPFFDEAAKGILSVIGATIMTKYELLASRTVVYVDTKDPMLTTKELVLCLVANGRRRDVVC